MPEEKILSTQLVVTILSNNISIRSYYNGSEVDINTLSAFISDIIQVVDGTSFIEGELGMTLKNYPSKIDYSIDSNGNLIVFGDDAANYLIDENTGELIYSD